ncbi:MAG: ATP-dependent RNA helicase RhlE [Sulfurimonas sp.]|jgi:ATP-dependent RNA helicase RhlE|uniref:helicase-related protein n=1 Tax=Sulfurimonas sp. TaxID=2022749 RepID=UPI0039E551AA
MPENDDKPKQKLYYDQRSVALRTTQCVYFVQEHDKLSMIELLLNNYKDTQIVVVVKSKKKADILSEFLISKEFKAIAVHGNHREEHQIEAATGFHLGALDILITTDMIFQTLDLDNIKLVLSYDLPDLVQDYYNRLSFMYEKGEAITFVSPEDDRLLSDIEFNMKQEIEEKVLDGFVATPVSNHSRNMKKDRKKKPRHRKIKVKKEKPE